MFGLIHQKQLDGQIEKYRKRTKNVSSLDSSRESSHGEAPSVELSDEKVSPSSDKFSSKSSQKGALLETPDARKIKSEQAEPAKGSMAEQSPRMHQEEPDPNKHQQEMEERL